jgi:hypothetical protein
MKFCLKCLQDKDETEFTKRTNGKLGSYCKHCFNFYQREHYKSNKEKYVKKSRKWDKEYFKWYKELKHNKPCTDCGIKYPYYVLQYDHLRDKSFNISSLATQTKSKKLILIEIDKCELVCANCHAIRTHNRLMLP